MTGSNLERPPPLQLVQRQLLETEGYLLDVVTSDFPFVSLLIALLLYREVRGIGWYRSLIYLPSLIGTSVGAESPSPPAVPAGEGRPWWIYATMVAFALVTVEWITWHRRVTV